MKVFKDIFTYDHFSKLSFLLVRQYKLISATTEPFLILKFTTILFLSICILCACMAVCAHVCSAHRGQQRALDPLELKL